MRENIPDNELQEEISVYTRISIDTEKESDNNTSIENQLKIIHNHIKIHFPKCKVKEYIDRDRSGYTFEQRENYMTMRQRIFEGKSKILIVKDFSRFSRRTSLGLWELEQMRDCGTRIISIMDGIDYPTQDDWLNITVRFMTNELPVTETSKKVKSSIATMQKAGEWLCAVPYGYIIKNQKKKIVDIVPDEAEVIKEIYRLYIMEGMGYGKIAEYLTEKKIPTPRMKEKMRAEEEEKDYKRHIGNVWNRGSIQEILGNDYYIGTFRGHKYTKTSINGKDKRVNEEDHIVIEKHHKAIIDDKTFLLAQAELHQRTKNKTQYRGKKKYDTPYTSYLFCGDCGSPMFSRSRPDLSPSYICGEYNKRGLKGCSSHHIRLDFLDGILKDYVRLVKLNSQDMIKELEKTITTEADSVKESEKVIQLLENQLSSAKEELKATKKQKIKDLARTPESADLVEETYFAIEEDLTYRIQGLQEQLKLNINKRSEVVEIARVARTVFDVFDDILKKEKLDRLDISLIVDKIFIFEDNSVDVHLKADIEHLLQTGTLPTEEQTVNFNFDSIGISYKAEYTHKSPKHQAKAYTVNVVNDGDPLEIYTEKDGEVIFKKYSPIGELGEFATTYAETLSKTTGKGTCITDRDNIIAVSGIPKKDLIEKKISQDLDGVISERTMFKSEGFDSGLTIAEGVDKYNAGVVAPIISEGDTIGSVIFVLKDGEEPDEIDTKLAESAAGFLGRHMEG